MKLTRKQLKILSIIAMTLDHVGVFLLSNTNPLYYIFRFIGRLTCPIMCYFIASGYLYTKNKTKYGLRLLLFMLISQVPFSLVNTGEVLSMNLNVIYTLLLAYLSILVIDKSKDISINLVIVFLLFTLSLIGDWGGFAVLYTIIFFIFRDKKILKYTFISLINIALISFSIYYQVANHLAWYLELYQLGLFLVIPVLELFENKKEEESKLSKWFFYIYYPLHLLIIYFI